MEDITQKDARLMEAADEVLSALVQKTVDIYRETDNGKLMALKQSLGKDISSAELAGIMHMLVFLSDDSLSSKMRDAVNEYTSS